MRTYAAIDLKSFYASVECVDRALEPLTTNLVVADSRRTEKTICLAVSPSLKALGVPGRARLFEVIEKVGLANARRKEAAPGRRLEGSSIQAPELAAGPGLAIDYLVAPPRMGTYLTRSAEVYQVYLKYIAPEDIHVYSIDEVFLDLTAYLETYHMTARQLVMTMILDVLHTTGITATAGIAPNLYLCKIAMDIGAKHIAPDENGVRICTLDELSYRKNLWTHRPLTDFWRVGKGIAKKLEAHGMYTMGDIARCSLGGPRDYRNEDLLYQLFGVNAELLIDHAWGWEPCTIADIKAYKPENSSIASGQVLQDAYTFQKAKLVMREMGEAIALDLVEKGMVCDQLTITVGYDRENLQDPGRRERYHGPVTRDPYGREIPKHGHGTVNLGGHTASTRRILEAILPLFDRVVDPSLLIRRLNLTANHILREDEVAQQTTEQLSLFVDPAAEQAQAKADRRERLLQETMVRIRQKHGKNAILKGCDLKEGATAMERNRQIGGHQA